MVNQFTFFPNLLNSIQETNEASIKESSKDTYNSHLTGKFGWITFVEMYNLKYNSNFSPLPVSNDENDVLVISYLDLLKMYLQVRCLDGFSAELNIALSENNLPVASSTAGIVYSAIRWYIDMNGFFGKNPMDLPIFAIFLKGFKSKIREGLLNAKQSKALTYQDMELLTLSDKLNLSSSVRIWFNCIISVSYTCFLRCDEALSLKMDNIKLEYDNDGVPYYKLTLTERKVQMDNAKDFFIYNNLTEPAINAFYFITLYRNHLKSRNVLNNADMYFFASCNKNKLSFLNKHSVSNFCSLLKKQLTSAGIESRLYSTHTFRRGGARHRLLYGKFRWPLQMICQWASWSGDSSVLQRYLIDTMSDEQTEDQKAALKFQTSSFTAKDVHSTYMNQFGLLFNKLDTMQNQFDGVRKRNVQTTFVLQPAPKPSLVTTEVHHQQENCYPSAQDSSEMRNLYEIEDCRTVNDVIVQWVVGNPTRKIPPLCKWTKDNYKGRKELYWQRKQIGRVYDLYDSRHQTHAFVQLYCHSKSSISKARVLASAEFKRESKN